jgi:hypothetical protein
MYQNKEVSDSSQTQFERRDCMNVENAVRAVRHGESRVGSAKVPDLTP